LAKARSISGLFSRSVESRRRLDELRVSLGKTPLVHKSYCQTRWDSTWDMVERLLELREDVTLLAMRNEVKLPCAPLTNAESILLSTLAKLLKLFRDTTKELSSDSATLSVVRPFVQALLKGCAPCADRSDVGVRAMKAAMSASLKVRFAQANDSLLYKCATYLDPRFKGNGFGGGELCVVKAEIARRGESLAPPPPERDENEPPKAKKPRPDSEDSIWGLMGDLAPSSSKESVAEAEEAAELGGEMERYDSTKVVSDRRKDPGEWWAERKAEFPLLSKVALFYAALLPSSVPSEQLFSSAGLLYSDRRKRLGAEKAAQLLFLHKNLPVTGFFS
jgi:hypothetical protein